jgi:hypothetical protein
MLQILLNIQHTVNSLHIYCRLIEAGYDKNKSLWVCNIYEKTIFRFIINPILKTSILLYKKINGCSSIFDRRGPCRK